MKLGLMTRTFISGDQKLWEGGHDGGLPDSRVFDSLKTVRANWDAERRMRGATLVCKGYSTNRGIRTCLWDSGGNTGMLLVSRYARYLIVTAVFGGGLCDACGCQLVSTQHQFLLW